MAYKSTPIMALMALILMPLSGCGLPSMTDDINAIVPEDTAMAPPGYEVGSIIKSENKAKRCLRRRKNKGQVLTSLYLLRTRKSSTLTQTL